MNTKNLIIFSYDYPPSNGGIARLCQEIATGMNPYYSSIKVLTRKKNGISKPYNYNQVEIIELPSSRIQCEIAAWKYLVNLKNKRNTDVLCGVWHPEAFISIMANIKNLFILTHGTELLSGTSVFREKIWLPFYGKWVLSQAQAVIANSVYTKRLSLAVNPRSKSYSLPLAVNENFFKPLNSKKNNEKINFCTVSRILKFKGYDFIAKAIASLPEINRNKILWNIGGTGIYLNELKELVQKLGIEDNVKFHGFVPDKDLPKFYNENDVFILCSREESTSTQVEGFGLVFLEAQSCGIPVIGTNTGGIPDAVLSGKGGWLIEQDNLEELIKLLNDLIYNRNKIVEQGMAARKRVEESANWKYYCKNLNKIMSLQ